VNQSVREGKELWRICARGNSLYYIGICSSSIGEGKREGEKIDTVTKGGDLSFLILWGGRGRASFEHAR